MSIKLSVLVPSIRPKNLWGLYHSITNSFSGEFEMIVITPYDIPDKVKKPNVHVIKDWGTPIRCQQIGLIKAKGEYISWAADDGQYLDGALDIAFNKIDGKGYKSLIMGKYLEGSGNTDAMKDNFYYVIRNHYPRDFKGFRFQRSWMLNVGIVSRKLLLEVGGWDCQFEVCPMSYCDLAVRLQNHDCEFIIQDEIMFGCSHSPGRTGDHAPIHDAQTEHDVPLFKEIYGRTSSQERIFIDLDNYKKSPVKWGRRFD